MTAPSPAAEVVPAAQPVVAARSSLDYLSCLQAYRGLAALAVLLFHIDKLFHTRLGVELACGKFFRAGYLGVDFFFVLSGFIILYTNAHSIGNPLAAKKYFYRRVTRIYPVFLSVFLLKLIFVFAGGELGGGKTDLSLILASALLLPQVNLPLLDVAWTLSFELAFYGLFLLLIIYGSNLWRAVVLHGCVVVAVNLPGVPALGFPASFMFSPFFLEFYLGCLACRLILYRTWSFRVALTTFSVGIVGTVIGYLCYSGFLPQLRPHGELARTIFWGMACSLLVFGSVALGAGFDRWVPRVFRELGDASYSVYLMHGTFINFCLAFIGRTANPAQWAWLYAPLVGFIALVGSYVYYLMVEKQLLNLCRRATPK